MNGLITFVTPALAPFSRSAIARTLERLLACVSVQERGRIVIVYSNDDLEEADFRRVYPDIHWIKASTDTYRSADEFGALYPPISAYRHSLLHGRSVAVMQALRTLESEYGSLAYVEFPDQGGVGFASLQEKYLGNAFQSTVLAVRLYGPDSMLYASGVQALNDEVAAIYDLERKSLCDCDLVVAASPDVSAAVRQFFDFDIADWDAKVCCHFPPLGVCAAERESAARGSPIALRTRIGNIEAAQLFIRGCSGVLRQHPDFNGPIHMDVRACDNGQRHLIRGLIPESFTARFILDETVATESAPGEQVIFVSPVAFDAVGLDAYEAAEAGAWCVLNSVNPGYGCTSSWQDGMNCTKFDGSPADLTRAVSDLLAALPALPAGIPPSGLPPWRVVRTSLPKPVDTERKPLVTVLIPHYNLGAYLSQTLASIRASDYENYEILIVDDASTDSVSINMIAQLARSDDPHLSVVQLPQNRGLAAARNVGVALAKGEFVMPLDADDLIHPRFMSLAAQTLVRHETIDFVVPQAAYFDDGDAPLTKFAVEDCLVFVGEARALGFRENRFSTATMVARKEVLRTLRYREHLRAFEDWDLYQRAVAEGRRLIVTNPVYFFYRRRSDSMVHSAQAAGKLVERHQDTLRSKFIVFDKMRLPLYALFSVRSNPFSAVNSETDRVHAKLQAYEQSEVVAMALSIAHIAKRSINSATAIATRLISAFRKSV